MENGKPQPERIRRPPSSPTRSATDPGVLTVQVGIANTYLAKGNLPQAETILDDVIVQARDQELPRSSGIGAAQSCSHCSETRRVCGGSQAGLRGAATHRESGCARFCSGRYRGDFHRSRAARFCARRAPRPHGHRSIETRALDGDGKLAGARRRGWNGGRIRLVRESTRLVRRPVLGCERTSFYSWAKDCTDWDVSLEPSRLWRRRLRSPIPTSSTRSHSRRSPR